MVTKQEYGLEVFGPLDGTEHTADIVFLHGIAATAQSAFSNLDRDLWTKQLLSDIPGCRVIHPNYKIPRFHPFKRIGFSEVNDHAPALVNALTGAGVGKVTTAIVAHSLGAIYAINALRFSAQAEGHRHRGLVKATAGVAFLAGAIKGSPWARLLGKLPNATPAFRALSDQNGEHLDRAKWYADTARRAFAIDSTAYVETRSIWGVTAVPRNSADPGVFGCNAIPVDRNHVAIARVSGATDGVYPSLVCDLQAWLKTDRIPTAVLTYDEMQALSQELSAFSLPPDVRRANFARYLSTVQERLGITNVRVDLPSNEPIKVQVMRFRDAVALGLIDLIAFYPDDLEFSVVQGPVIR